MNDDIVDTKHGGVVVSLGQNHLPRFVWQLRYYELKDPVMPAKMGPMTGHGVKDMVDQIVSRLVSVQPELDYPNHRIEKFAVFRNFVRTCMFVSLEDDGDDESKRPHVPAEFAAEYAYLFFEFGRTYSRSEIMQRLNRLARAVARLPGMRNIGAYIYDVITRSEGESPREKYPYHLPPRHPERASPHGSPGRRRETHRPAIVFSPPPPPPSSSSERGEYVRKFFPVDFETVALGGKGAAAAAVVGSAVNQNQLPRFVWQLRYLELKHPIMPLPLHSMPGSEVKEILSQIMERILSVQPELDMPDGKMEKLPSVLRYVQKGMFVSFSEGEEHGNSTVAVPPEFSSYRFLFFELEHTYSPSEIRMRIHKLAEVVAKMPKLQNIGTYIFDVLVRAEGKSPREQRYAHLQ